MKALYITTVLMACLASGCSTTGHTEDPSSKVVQNCCNDENYQSGYYYNGYQENGWRYCVSKRVEYK